jgi:hypothetical protein
MARDWRQGGACWQEVRTSAGLSAPITEVDIALLHGDAEQQAFALVERSRCRHN